MVKCLLFVFKTGRWLGKHQNEKCEYYLKNTNCNAVPNYYTKLFLMLFPVYPVVPASHVANISFSHWFALESFSWKSIVGLFWTPVSLICLINLVPHGLGCWEAL